MPNHALQALVDDVSRDGKVSADEALSLRKSVFTDGVVSRDEADALVYLESRVANSDEAWAAAFVEAISDHVLQSGQFPGLVDEETAAWLMRSFGAEGGRETEVETLLKIVERADSVLPTLVVFMRERCATYLAGRTFTASDVELMRRCLYAGEAFVSEDEVNWLSAVDAESDGRAHDASWRDLFVKAMLNHLMGRHTPAMLEDPEGMRHRQAWLRDTSVRPMRSVLGMFSDGWTKYNERRKQLGELDQLETYYEASNANAEEDAQLTLTERAWASGMVKRDGKLTANEEAFLAELVKVEDAEPSV